MARKKYTELEKELIKQISINIKNLLLKQKCSQTTLSEKTGLSTSTISDYVNGRTLISATNLHKLANALGVPKTDIYPSEDNVYDPKLRTVHIENLSNYPLAYKGRPLSDDEKEDITRILDAVLKRWDV